MIVHLVDGTYELFRHFYGLRRFNQGVDRPYGAVVGVLQTVLQMIENGDTYLGVATDHVIESFRNRLWADYKTGAHASRYHDGIRDSRIATSSAKNLCERATHEWLFRLRFAQSRGAQLDLAPILAVFASRSVISTPPRFARDYSARAKVAVFVETHRLRTYERDQGVSRKPSWSAIRESRIASSPRPALNPILTVIRYALHSRGA
jgi:hypothetical protein